MPIIRTAALNAIELLRNHLEAALLEKDKSVDSQLSNEPSVELQRISIDAQVSYTNVHLGDINNKNKSQNNNNVKRILSKPSSRK